jgi:hypothetical protein
LSKHALSPYCEDYIMPIHYLLAVRGRMLTDVVIVSVLFLPSRVGRRVEPFA